MSALRHTPHRLVFLALTSDGAAPVEPVAHLFDPVEPFVPFPAGLSFVVMDGRLPI